MAATLAEERDNLARLRVLATAILDRATDESRDLTEGEEKEFDSLMTEVRLTEHRMQKLQLRDLAASAGGSEARAIVAAASHLETPTTMTTSLRSMIDAGVREATFAWPTQAEIRALESVENVDHAKSFSATVSQYLRTETPWMDLARIWTTDAPTAGLIPRITADPSSSSPGQGTAISEATPTLDSVDTGALTKYGVVSYLSNELVKSAGFDIDSIVAQHAARAIGQAFGDAVTDVAATLPALGTATGTPFVAASDLVREMYDLAAPYRTPSAGKWVFSTSMKAKAAGWTDTTGQFIWQQPVTGEPGRLFGLPVYEDPYATAPGSAVANAVLVGDFSRAIILRMTPIEVKISDEFRLATDELAIRVRFWAKAAVLDTAAAGRIVCGNS